MTSKRILDLRVGRRRRFRTARWFLVAVVAAGLAPASRADISTYSATFDSVSYSYSHDPFLGGTDSLVFIESSSGYPAYTGDFGADKQLRVTFSAPAGRKFVINPPIDADFLEFGMWFRSVAGMTVWTHADGTRNWLEGATVEFNGGEGTLPTLSPVFAYQDGFWAWSLGHPTGSFAFQSISVLYNVPAEYNDAFNSLDPLILFRGAASWFSEHDDPGMWLSTESVAAVPEPSTAATLLTTGAGLCLIVRRRRNRRAA